MKKRNLRNPRMIRNPLKRKKQSNVTRYDHS
jgi:hypothetical protein